MAPKGVATRPTGDRVREAAFSLIGPVDGATVLDLFAGSGAMGLEALSRGAASVTFVESDRAACRTIEQNLAKLRLTGARVVCADAVWTVRQDPRAYDLVLVDPDAGHTVDAAASKSLSRNNPWHGMSFTGAVHSTLLRGRVTARQGEKP